jgi:SRSO17 transposase
VGLVAPLVATDAGYGEITAFRQGLDDRQIPYIVQVKSGTSAYPEHVTPHRPEWSGRGRPPTTRYRDKPASLKDLALAAGKRAAQPVTWREGSPGITTSPASRSPTPS